MLFMRKLKILFIIRAAEHFGRYRSIIEPLAARGHRLTILFDRAWSTEKDLAKVEKFRGSFPNCSYDWLVNRGDRWRGILFTVRSLLTYRRYLTLNDQSDFFRKRWHAYMPFWLRIPCSFPPCLAFLKTRFAERILRAAEERIPADKRIVEQIRMFRPDAVVSAIVGIRVLSPNIEYIKAAQALGIPAPAALVSWDSLTTKSVMTVVPDVALLWNDVHVRQIWDHHRIPRERTRIVGAPVFDKWFTPLTVTDRRAFAAAHGLSPEDPIVLYLGAAKGTAEDETWLIRELREAFDRSADAPLRRAQIVVRPHPANARHYANVDLPGVWVIPKGGALPDTENALQLSHDSYCHAVAAVGVFTSAMMEAMIVGTPVVVIFVGRYRETQADAAHFKDFIASGGQAVVRSVEEAAEVVSSLIAGRDTQKAKREEFVRRIIRPRGLNQNAGALAADAIEECVRQR